MFRAPVVGLTSTMCATYLSRVCRLCELLTMYALVYAAVIRAPLVCLIRIASVIYLSLMYCWSGLPGSCYSRATGGNSSRCMLYFRAGCFVLYVCVRVVRRCYKRKCAPLWAIYVLHSPFVLSAPLITTLSTLRAVRDACAVGIICAISCLHYLVLLVLCAREFC